MWNSSWAGRQSLGHLGLLFFIRIGFHISSNLVISCLIHFPADCNRRPQSSYRWMKLLDAATFSIAATSFLPSHGYHLPSQPQPPPFIVSAGQEPAQRKLPIQPIGPSPPQSSVAGCLPVLQVSPTVRSHLLFHWILNNSTTSDG